MFDNWVLLGFVFLPHVLKHCSGLLSRMEKHPYDPSFFFFFLIHHESLLELSCIQLFFYN